MTFIFFFLLFLSSSSSYRPHTILIIVIPFSSLSSRLFFIFPLIYIYIRFLTSSSSISLTHPYQLRPPFHLYSRSPHHLHPSSSSFYTYFLIPSLSTWSLSSRSSPFSSSSPAVSSFYPYHLYYPHLPRSVLVSFVLLIMFILTDILSPSSP